jgi:hypothetical protein
VILTPHTQEHPNARNINAYRSDDGGVTNERFYAKNRQSNLSISDPLVSQCLLRLLRNVSALKAEELEVQSRWLSKALAMSLRLVCQPFHFSLLVAALSILILPGLGSVSRLLAAPLCLGESFALRSLYLTMVETKNCDTKTNTRSTSR